MLCTGWVLPLWLSCWTPASAPLRHHREAVWCSSGLFPGALQCCFRPAPLWAGSRTRRAAAPQTPSTVIHQVITADYDRFIYLPCFTLERIGVGLQNTCDTRGGNRYQEKLGQKEKMKVRK